MSNDRNGSLQDPAITSSTNVQLADLLDRIANLLRIPPIEHREVDIPAASEGHLGKLEDSVRLMRAFRRIEDAHDRAAVIRMVERLLVRSE